MTRPISTIRKTLHATAGVLAVVASLGAGAGMSSAAPAHDDVTAPMPLTSTSPDDGGETWKLANHTGQVVHGNWTLSGGDETASSHIVSAPDHPWRIDEVNSVWERYTKPMELNWLGDVCYNKSWWHLRTMGWGDSVSLEVDSKGTLWAVISKSGSTNINRLPMAATGACLESSTPT
ncbi:hypothetical protein R3Q06_33250 [Rhodococcus erythropolis]|uniref:hypothetical protein n=1 Tax=Rhodococcus erythropolis TaxID=1833 RepID=UPI002949D513|nr:hypothetical protein [Rhodococcus erythropolis]MDV6278312.1 hypothetical protein [Rhodococcus erythropolis]